MIEERERPRFTSGKMKITKEDEMGERWRRPWLARMAGCVLCLVMCWLTPPATAATNDPLTVEAALGIALDGNPGLAEIQARAEALATVPSQAGSLPDPVLGFNALNMPTDTFDMSQEAMTQFQVGLTQALPFPGKLALKEEASRYAALAAADSLDEARLRLSREVRITWWRLFASDRALEILDRNIDLFRQFTQIAGTKYEVGKGLQQDVLLAQVELSKLHDQRLGIGGRRDQLAARLNKLMGRSALLPIILPAKVDEKLPEVAPAERLAAAAERNRPLLRQLENEVKAARARAGLAEKELYPDFKVGAFYGFRQGDNPPSVGGDRADLLSVKLSMNLPLYQKSKQRQAIVQKNKELMQVEMKRRDAENEISRAIADAHADLHRAREQLQLLDDGIIPQARQTVDSMLAGYQVNKVDFLNLVRSQMTLLNYENRYWQTLSAANQALARLEAAVGGEVTP